jgi:hypothetical protein
MEALFGRRSRRFCMGSEIPDGVLAFKSKHAPMPLNELEAFISTHRHLPGIPSEQEVVANGVNVGEMLKLQMQKIEEMMLYILQLKKENDELREMIINNN